MSENMRMSLLEGAATLASLTAFVLFLLWATRPHRFRRFGERRLFESRESQADDSDSKLSDEA